MLFMALSGYAVEKPNIIFVMADDLGYNDLGCYGQKHIQTPHLDQMAREGMKFTDFYSGAPVCAPARSVLMTGQHTGHTTIRGNFGKGGVVGLGGGKGRVPLKESDIAISQVLQKAGYITGMTGKWGIGEPGTTGEVKRKGWDEFFGYVNQRRAHTYYPTYIWKNDQKFILEGNHNGQKQQYTHDMFAEFALDFIERHQDKPFFLYLPYLIPHSDYEIPSVEPYQHQTTWSQDEKVHAAMITRLDQDMGEMFALLKKLNIDEKTLVFFTSDNGAAKRWDGRFDSSGVLRGKKRDVYEGGIRVPMLVRWPGKISQQSVSSTPAWFPDIYPTLANLAGSRDSHQVDGLDIMPTLLGKNQNLEQRQLYWEFYEKGFKQAMRKGPWKAIRYAGKPIEIYNLEKDLAEQHNVAAQHPEVVEVFERAFSRSRVPSEHWPAPIDRL